MQRAHGLAARGDAVVTQDGPIDSSSAYAFGMSCNLFRRRNMVLQCAFDRGESCFPFRMGEQSTSTGAEQAAQDGTGTNCHCAFR
ncbi:MAG: hypothetical protein EOR57_14130 [Mesorhizobium sp.]|uniref:hypothetical protein n=1 Tax=Mesorhizobium sp. TaxID=1871066 RepID=UPI000FE82E04|nr:hypothetical protein [Mesorhizobium sp.]RWL19727.1 MAG: hypothetical protein EOR57_14130 [Mesorhizobium sp.]